MAEIIIWSNYEIVNSIKVFGEIEQKARYNTKREDGICDFDAAKNELWDAFDKFRADFNFPTNDGIIYEFSPTEMDLHHTTNDKILGNVEGFEYDDGTTFGRATIYEK